MPLQTPDARTIIIDDAVPYAHEMFGHLGQVILLPGSEINANAVKSADALIVRSRTQVNHALLAESQVRFVGSTVVGLDHIDQAYLASRDITFYSAQGCNANSVAEFIITAIVELAEHFNFQIKDKTLGIIGVGHVGSLVHKKATALGMTCLLNDPPRALMQETSPHNKQKALAFVDLETCLTADIITVHTPLTKTGQHKTLDLLSAHHLKNIKPSQILINAARGGIINEAAWTSTQTQANIIDCWENEPAISHALYQTAYLATPHIAGHSLEAKVAGSEMVYHALCQAENPTKNRLETEPPLPTDSHLPSDNMQSTSRFIQYFTKNALHSR